MVFRKRYLPSGRSGLETGHPPGAGPDPCDWNLEWSVGHGWRQPWMVAAKSNSPLDCPLAKLAEHELESLLGLVLEPDSGLESVLDLES